LIHEEDSLLSHVPDHIVARKHGGATDESNLAWACYLCNHLKGSDIASVDIETGRIVRLLHPRRDRWSRHFQLRNGRILPLTAVGRVTEYLLQFNDPQSVEMRQTLTLLGRYPR
jgi:HNH endonuclease